MATVEKEQEYRLTPLDKVSLENACYDMMDLIEQLDLYPSLARKMEHTLDRIMEASLYALVPTNVEPPGPAEPPQSTATGEAIDRVRSTRKARF